jgi:hypothetical protein
LIPASKIHLHSLDLGETTVIFSDFKSLESALEAFKLHGHIREFIAPLPHRLASVVRERIELLCRIGYSHSEAAVSEGLIFPVLLEVWTAYVDVLKIWSRQEFGSKELHGVADYAVSRVREMGQLRFTPPYAIIVEAKQEKFDEGWGQCLAGMLAAQRLNQPANQTIYGIVTTGLLWQFGSLQDRTFTQDPRSFALSDLDLLCGAVRFLFEQVKHYEIPPEKDAA